MSRSLAALLVAASLMSFTRAGRATAPEAHLDISGFLAALQRLSSAVAALGGNSSQASTLAAQLPAAWRVELGGQDFRVSAHWLRTELNACAANPHEARHYQQQIEQRLSVMEAAARNSAATGPESLSLAAARLRQILAEPDLRAASQTHRTGQVAAAINAAIRRFFRRILAGFESHPAVSDVLASIIGGLLVLAMIALLIRSLARPLKYRELGLTAPASVPATWQESARAALRAAGEGDFRNAIRLCYDASILRLEQAGIWQVLPDRTHREYLSLIPPAAAERAAFLHIATDFENVWYGGRPATDKDFRSIVRELELLGCTFR
ncbi:MAG: DUF4129 domain-containing protein [Terriglobia bacterium]